MNKCKAMVFFGAHPDDESFGPGATLAQYAAAGVDVYYVCCTGGEMGTVDPRHLKENQTIKQLRLDEMKSAAAALRLKDVFYLGYRDSGMRGSAENKHPDSLAMASLEEATGRAVKIIRNIKPNVVITHDAGGGYGHPDHIATHEAAVKAFYAAGDPAQYPEAGPAFRPDKLYFGVRPRGVMKMMVRLMPLFGQDPHHFGRNKDIDLTKMNATEYPVHAAVCLNKESIAARNKAVACHASQSSGGGRRPGVFRIAATIDKIRGPHDYFMREYPTTRRRMEKDLFDGIKG